MLRTDRLGLRALAIAFLAVGCPSGGPDAVGDAEADKELACRDGADNDYDGLFDCDDPDCRNAPHCVEADDDPGDDDDVVDDDDAVVWDWGPPNVQPGAVLVGILQCGMLQGSSDLYWQWDGEAWNAIDRVPHDLFETIDDDGSEIFDGRPFSQVVNCFRPGSKRTLEWGEDGSFVFYNGDWVHDLAATATEGRWFGGVSPLFDVPEDCLQGMDELGVVPPVALSFERAGVLP